MTQRLFAKLDALEQSSRESLAKYARIECRGLGKLQLKPYVSTPLTFEFKEDYELPSARRSIISGPKPSPQLAEEEQIFTHLKTRSESPRLMIRKNHTGKSTIRPFSAPDNLQAKPCYQQEDLHTLKEGFITLKLSQKVKPVSFRAKVHRRPKWKTEVERVQKLKVLCQQENEAHLASALNHKDTSHWCSSRNATSQNEEILAPATTGDKLGQYSTYGESGKTVAQQLERDNKICVCVNELLSSDDQKAGNEALLKESAFNQGSVKSNLQSKKCNSEEKKNLISLSIEDEMEKPGAKIIHAGSSKAKFASPVKASETYPITYSEERYMQKFILNRWPCVCRGKVSYDLENENSEACTNFNPVLQNNYDYALALNGEKEENLQNVTVKKNKKLNRTLSAKKKVSVHILSSDGKTKILINSQKEKTFVEKIVQSFFYAEAPVSKFTSKERNISTTKGECDGNDLLVHGVNPKLAVFYESFSTQEIPVAVSKCCWFYGKPLSTISHTQKKGRLAQSSQLSYISIAKPIEILPCADVTSQSAHNISTQCDDLENKHVIQSSSYFMEEPLPSQNKVGIFGECSQPASSFKEETPTDIKLNKQQHCLEGKKDCDASSGVSHTDRLLTSKGLQKEPNEDTNPQRKVELPECSLPLPALFTSHPVISIPTAQCDT
ncbi:uncharacterized protein LOC106737842 [Alligator mississippiensis]|uniref:uncharacterized protein LOC106737842 n=1 Tax=Alligator mississippiensis TaxID=8496 RepID=UPI0009071E01|nr:uncharacterized protein LOC106737842 [Alligator mississippiensis]XP_059583904.1 uncharacterized protein LOC106737842 [Alligator mississippiensis]